MSGAERRTSSRLPIDVPVFFEITLHTGALVPALLKDISAGGLQAGLSSTAGLKFSLGMEVLLLALPPAIDDTGFGLAAVVSWQSPERLGLRFHKPLPLTEDDVQAIIRDF